MYQYGYDSIYNKGATTGDVKNLKQIKKKFDKQHKESETILSQIDNNGKFAIGEYEISYNKASDRFDVFCIDEKVIRVNAGGLQIEYERLHRKFKIKALEKSDTVLPRRDRFLCCSYECGSGCDRG